MALSIVVAISHNQKTGVCAATYAPIQTCPKSCPLRNKGCYAQEGNCGIHFRRISRHAENQQVEVIARHEADQIRALPGHLPLRLHVTGDCPDNTCARIIAGACEEYITRYNMPVWVYTHAWRDVARESWGDISVLASCESVGEVLKAKRRGYRSALVTPLDLMAGHTIELIQAGIRPVICGHFAKQKQCVQCRICLREVNTCVLLPTHGSRSKMVDGIIWRLRNERKNNV